MLSTMESYFEGRRELFDNLWLGKAEVEWFCRAVFRLNFVMTGASPDSLKSTLESHLIKWERDYDVNGQNLDYGQRFFNVIEKAAQTSGRKVVILVDEYDKTLVNTMHDMELHEQMKDILKPVFSVLKGADRYIEFAILTGVTRFSKLNIFSDLNNLIDISLDERFSTICGITEDEINTYFNEGVKDFANKEGVDYHQMMTILKENYDGYHFSANCPDLYNPFSLINALSRQSITHSWFESGTPTFLVKQIKNTEDDIRDVLNPETSATTLATMSAFDSGLTNLLYQTGYLTIKDYDKNDDVYTLGIPNREVEIGLFSALLPLYTGKDEQSNDSALIKLRRAIRGGEVDKFMQTLKSLLSGIPYDLSEDKHEIYYENNLFLIFKLVGFNATTEYRTSDGRIDILLETSKYIYIIELKLNGTAEEALSQIIAKDYGCPFETDGREIIRIGVSFSKSTRSIDRWVSA